MPPPSGTTISTAPRRPTPRPRATWTTKVAFGNEGKSLKCIYEKGSQGKGNRKVFFGDSPTGKVVRKGEKFEDVYWRLYVKHQYGWTGGGPDKLSRATSIVSGQWNAGHDRPRLEHRRYPHAGPGQRRSSATRSSRTKYNDFDNLHWLGQKPAATMPISSTAESGWWVCGRGSGQTEHAPAKRMGCSSSGSTGGWSPNARISTGAGHIPATPSTPSSWRLTGTRAHRWHRTAGTITS